MNILYLGVFVLSFWGIPSTVVSVPDMPIEAPVVRLQATSTPEWIIGRVYHYASFYGVPAELMLKIIKAESGFNPNAINSSPKEYSVGLCQINLKAHFKNGITKEMALDPEFSLDFLARNLRDGKCKMWTTCPLPTS